MLALISGLVFPPSPGLLCPHLHIHRLRMCIGHDIGDDWPLCVARQLFLMFSVAMQLGRRVWPLEG